MGVPLLLKQVRFVGQDPELQTVWSHDDLASELVKKEPEVKQMNLQQT